MSSDHKLASRAWLVVGLLWFVGCLNYLDRGMITTMRGSLVEAIPMTDTQFGLLTSVFLWVYGLLSPFAGFLADRFNRSLVVIISLFAWSLTTWMTAHTTTFAGLLATRALMGVSEACYIPAALALIADYHRGSSRSLAIGVHMTGIMVGSGLGGLGGWIAERHGWSHPFQLFGIIGIVYSVLVAFLLRDAPDGRGSIAAKNVAGVPERSVGLREAFASLFSRPAFILTLLYWGLLGLAASTNNWMPSYLNEEFHLSQGVAGLSATGYLSAAALAGLLVGGGWADRWNRTNPWARIYVPGLGLLIAAPGFLLAASAHQLSFAIAGLAIYGFARAFTDSNMMPILCMVSDPRYRATGYGVLNSFACIVAGGTVYVGGAVRDAHINVSYIFQVGAFLLLGCSLLLFAVKVQVKARGSTEV